MKSEKKTKQHPNKVYPKTMLLSRAPYIGVTKKKRRKSPFTIYSAIYIGNSMITPCPSSPKPPRLHGSAQGWILPTQHWSDHVLWKVTWRGRWCARWVAWPQDRAVKQNFFRHSIFGIYPENSIQQGVLCFFPYLGTWEYSTCRGVI